MRLSVCLSVYKITSKHKRYRLEISSHYGELQCIRTIALLNHSSANLISELFHTRINEQDGVLTMQLKKR